MLVFFVAVDAKTSVMFVFLEPLGVGGVVVAAARPGAPNKPILVIKSGRSPAAQ
ncbi:hypothetical protein ACVGWD_00380, partial [Enterobacter asburiae]